MSEPVDVSKAHPLSVKLSFTLKSKYSSPASLGILVVYRVFISP